MILCSYADAEIGVRLRGVLCFIPDLMSVCVSFDWIKNKLTNCNDLLIYFPIIGKKAHILKHIDLIEDHFDWILRG